MFLYLVYFFGNGTIWWFYENNIIFFLKIACFTLSRDFHYNCRHALIKQKWVTYVACSRFEVIQCSHPGRCKLAHDLPLYNMHFYRKDPLLHRDQYIVGFDMRCKVGNLRHIRTQRKVGVMLEVQLMIRRKCFMQLLFYTIWNQKIGIF